MMVLKYKTRGNSLPQGKPRVFFTCHPSDFDSCFEIIASLILNLHNCAVYYIDPNENSTITDVQNQEDLFSQVINMQLVVIPITTKALIERNDAINVFFPFAEQQHIAVLPIMMEGNLDELFARKCGNIQYLNILNTDSSEIPFEEKLEKLLSSVLVGEDLAERVRAAFEAYVFLSYRKKDRLYAQKLMRMIHKKKQYYRTAIWYDEYLIPGEDFNSAIRSALEKSDIFAMVVTPNLLERSNYVMEQEYPAAQKCRKEIVAFEMQKTDRQLLEQFYEDVPECIEAEELEQREELFVDFLHNLAMQETEDDPQHNFLIGLAYLDGIDVEIDNEKAFMFIKSAAETGELEAIEKLVEMFHEGKGVKRNYDTSLYWREKLIEELRQRWEENQSRDYFIRYLDSLLNCGDEYYSLYRLDRAKEYYYKVYEESAHFGKKADEYGFNDTAAALSLIRIGLIENSLERAIDAKNYYEKALEVSKALENNIEVTKLNTLLARCYRGLGDAEKTNRKYDEAKMFFEEALKLDKTISEQTGTNDSYRNLAIGYNKLGEVEGLLGQLEIAKECFEKSLKIYQNISEEERTLGSRINVADSYKEMGTFEALSLHPQKAKEYYEIALQIYKDIVDETRSLESRMKLSSAYSLLAQVENNNYETTKGYLEFAMQINKDLAEETEAVRFSRYLSASYIQLGDLDNKYGNKESAKDYYEKALEASKEITIETETANSRENLHECYAKLGNIMFSLRQYEKARECYIKTIGLCVVPADEIGSIKTQKALIEDYEQLGLVEVVLGHKENAKEYIKKALDIGRSLDKKYGLIESENSQILLELIDSEDAEDTILNIIDN